MQEEWKKLLVEFDLWPQEGIREYTVPMSNLPYLHPDGRILTGQGQHRSTLEGKAIVNQGVNCIIQKGIRTSNMKRSLVAIKRPKYPHQHLRLEAFVQALAYNALKKEGIIGAIAKPYDVFTFANEARFTMEWVEGISCYEFLAQYLGQPANFQTMFLHVLLQTAYIMDALGRNLSIDHRDMKLDNLWIRQKPITYSIVKGGKTTLYSCPFQVVLLDFGFACLGTAERQTLLNLGNAIPDIDPCPKEGRDLYHILNRLLEPPYFADMLSPVLRKTLLSWMEPVGPSHHSGSHVKTSLPKFALPALSPAAVLAWCLAHGKFGTG
jgi:serine/threonine protein kinase